METKDLGKTSIGGMSANLAAALSYLLGPITGIFLYLVEENKFVRFHAMQSSVTFAAIWVVSVVLLWVPILGLVISLLLSLVSLILWIVLMIKAFQGEKFKLPIFGDIAEQNS